MEWTRAIDAYCERTDAGYWAEPVNALTNAAFLIAAVIMWRRTGGMTGAMTGAMTGGQVLSGILALIGIGSWLFHTHATAWAAAADTTPILAFVLVYIFLANRDFWGWPTWAAAVGAVAYVPFTMVLTPVFAWLPFFGISSFYWPLPVLIFGYAALLRGRSQVTARNLAIGAAILCASLAARSVDQTFCAALPLGTHWLWHCLNAVMLGWMIETWRRHVQLA